MRLFFAIGVLLHMSFILACSGLGMETVESGQVPVEIVEETTSVPDVRAFDHRMVVLCMKDGVTLEDVALCPDTVHQIGFHPIQTTGEIRISEFFSTISPIDEEALGDPCGEIRHIEQSTPHLTRDVGRRLTHHDLQSKKYQSRIASAVGLKSVPLRVLARVDLDGNGTEEVLFEVNTDRPANAVGMTQSVSLVGMRAIINKEVKTLFLHREVLEIEDDGLYMMRQTGSLVGVTDIDGDGRLEVVWTSDYYEGGATIVHEFDGTEFVEMGIEGCGA